MKTCRKILSAALRRIEHWLALGAVGGMVASVPAADSVIISEFLARNTTGLTDEDGVHSDWIEIYNAGENEVNLGGWYLTDTSAALQKWQFPATNIGPGQFVLVWASDKNRRVPGAPLHTNFKLSDEGEYLGLIQVDGVTVASDFPPKFPPQFPDVTYGLVQGGATNHYLAWPTPGAPNSPATNFVVADLAFAPASGWYSNSVSVTITTATPGVTIYCSTNGGAPDSTNGFAYTGPIAVSGTMVIRAMAMRSGFVPTAPTAHSYLFLDQVIRQTGEGYPADWGYMPAVYSFNSNIVNDPRWSAEFLNDLRSVPTVSVAMNLDDLFGPGGIYTNPTEEGEEWERPCSVEYLRPDGGEGFQINCGIRLQGNWSRGNTPKQSLRLLFKQAYGAGKLDFNLYPESPVRQFDTLILHASFQDHWLPFGDPRAQMHRDRWCKDAQSEMGGFGAHGNYVHLYLNGLYWGLYNLGERPDAAYAAHYLGGEPRDYDAFNADELIDGTTNSWNEMFAIANAGITNDTAYESLRHYLDVPAFIDYLLLNFYAYNTDWPRLNWRAAGDVAHGVGFHFFSWDAEVTFGLGGAPVDSDRTDITEGSPAVLYNALRQHEDFRRLFGDRAQRHLFDEGVLTPTRCLARWRQRANEMFRAIVPETARWTGTNLYTRDDWVAEGNRVETEWFLARTPIFVAQLRAAGLYPAVEAPVCSPHGGMISDMPLAVAMTAARGEIYYTTNGSDPRLSDGAISPEAIRYEAGLSLTSALHLAARVIDTNAWSALVEADFFLADTCPVRFSRIMHTEDGTLVLEGQGRPGATYLLEASTKLLDWKTVAGLTADAAGAFQFTEKSAADLPARFYRLRLP